MGIYTCNAHILIFIFKRPVRMSVSQILEETPQLTKGKKQPALQN